MTALAGCWAFGGRSEPHADCQRQLDAQRNLGIEPRYWRSETLALGRAISRHLPEDCFDTGPVTVGGGKYALVADIRLDNRTELAGSLRLSTERLKQTCDAALLAECLLAWGQSTVQKLVGDFAFAWWDKSSGTLTLATDYMGQRPLHYAAGQGFFAFASMPRGLHALDRIARRPSLAAARGFVEDHGPASFFEDITLLPPGHLMTVREDRIKTEKWSQVASLPASGGLNDAVEEGRALLDEAVACRLRRNNAAMASHLSGGLDSSGVSATAAQLLRPSELLAFTAVPWGSDIDIPRGTIADESNLASAVAGQHENVVHINVAGGGSLLDVFERDLALWERPVPNPFNDMWWSKITADASAWGAHTLLTAPMGNIGLSYSGAELISELSLARRLSLLRQRLSDRRSRGFANWSDLVRLIVQQAPATARLARRLRGQSKPNPFLFPDNSTAVRALGERRDKVGSLERRLQIIGDTHPGNFHSGAIAGWGVDMRDALADKRLIEFTLRLPAEAFFQDGRPRALARKVLADRLPECVIGETRKGLQAADWYLSVIKERDGLIAEAEAIADSPAAEIINGQAISRALIDLPRTGWASHAVRHKYGSQLIAALQAGRFIRKTSGRGTY